MVKTSQVEQFLVDNGFVWNVDCYWYKMVKTQFQAFQCRAYVSFHSGFHLGFSNRHETLHMSIREDGVTMEEVLTLARNFNLMFRHISGEWK